MTYPNEPVTHEIGEWDGLTKRELFAAMAMQGLVSHGDWGIEDCAKMSVRSADALIAALNEGGTNA